MPEEALFDAVYDAPDDDAPREALAAVLRARRDPRGDFIALQLDRARMKTASRAVATSMKTLLTAHADSWLAPLGGALVARTIRWERGFPVSGRLALQRTADAREALIGRRALATLRALELEPRNSVQPVAWLERFLFETPLRHLRTLHDMPRSLLTRMLVASPPFAIETLDVAAEGGGGPSGEAHEQQLARSLADAFAAGSGLPALRALTFSFNHAFGRLPETYAWLWESALGRRLETLRMNLSVHSVASWHEALTRHAERLALRRLVFFGRSELALLRTDRGFTRLVGKLSPELRPKERENVEVALAALARVVSVEVDGVAIPPPLPRA